MLLQVARASRHTLTLTGLPTWCSTTLPAHFSTASTASTDTPAGSNHYDVLGVERTAPADVIKKAFRQVGMFEGGGLKTLPALDCAVTLV
jgi:hypothetical protein